MSKPKEEAVGYEPEEWLQENYRGVAAGRGVEVSALADEFEARSPRLAAWMRSQGKPQQERKRAPKARKAPEKQEG